MDVSGILELMKEMKISGVTELEWSADGQKLSLSRPSDPIDVNRLHALSGAHGQQLPGSQPATSESGSTVNVIGSDTTQEKPARPSGRVVSSPVVGIFYSAPAPDQDSFVTIGSQVDHGTPLGIIEAMKLMNEVVSPCSGVVVDILVDNTQRVEYGQPLFVIEEIRP